MDLEAKKKALRMIPYGFFVLTARADDGRIASGSINWLTQSSFKPPQVVVCVRESSFLNTVIEQTGQFVLNAVGTEQADMAIRFFKPAELEGNSLGGYAIKIGSNGAAILTDSPAYLECEVVGSHQTGDHTVYVGEIKEAFAGLDDDSRPDECILRLEDLEGDIYYGG